LRVLPVAQSNADQYLRRNLCPRGCKDQYWHGVFGLWAIGIFLFDLGVFVIAKVVAMNTSDNIGKLSSKKFAKTPFSAKKPGNLDQISAKTPYRKSRRGRRIKLPGVKVDLELVYRLWVKQKKIPTQYSPNIAFFVLKTAHAKFYNLRLNNKIIQNTEQPLPKLSTVVANFLLLPIIRYCLHTSEVDLGALEI
jgi:hypothetical protein